MIHVRVSEPMAAPAQKEDPRVLKLKETNAQLQTEAKFQGVAISEAAASFVRVFSSVV